MGKNTNIVIIDPGVENDKDFFNYGSIINKNIPNYKEYYVLKKKLHKIIRKNYTINNNLIIKYIIIYFNNDIKRKSLIGVLFDKSIENVLKEHLIINIDYTNNIYNILNTWMSESPFIYKIYGLYSINNFIITENKITYGNMYSIINHLKKNVYVFDINIH